MKRLKIFLLALIGAVAVSCNEPDYYTGVVINKKYEPSSYRDWYEIVLMTDDGKHALTVDETTYHKYNIGDTATLENLKRY
jgi:lipoprotein|nr:MAG TPA: Protein of unknown function (DUF2500) [Caudoviricetes sp.]